MLKEPIINWFIFLWLANGQLSKGNCQIKKEKKWEHVYQHPWYLVTKTLEDYLLKIKNRDLVSFQKKIKEESYSSFYPHY